MSIRTQRLCELCDFAIGQAKRFQIGQLRSDVDIYPHDLKPLQLGGHRINVPRFGYGNAKFIFRFSCRNFCMCLGVNIGVHADRNGYFFAVRAGHFIQKDHFRFAFDINLTHAPLNDHFHFCTGFSDTGKNDAIGWNTCPDCAQVFSARHHIHPRTKCRKGFDDRLI